MVVARIHKADMCLGPSCWIVQIKAAGLCSLYDPGGDWP